MSELNVDGEPINSGQVRATLESLQRDVLSLIIKSGATPLDAEYKTAVNDFKLIRTYIEQKDQRILQLSAALFQIRQCTNILPGPEFR